MMLSRARPQETQQLWEIKNSYPPPPRPRINYMAICLQFVLPDPLFQTYTTIISQILDYVKKTKAVSQMTLSYEVRLNKLTGVAKRKEVGKQTNQPTPEMSEKKISIYIHFAITANPLNITFQTLQCKKSCVTASMSVEALPCGRKLPSAQTWTITMHAQSGAGRERSVCVRG